MLKPFSLISIISAASIVFVADTAFSNSLPTSSIYPEVSNPDIAQPVCYMQTVDGRTLNLSRLCEKKQKPVVQPQITISNVIQEGDRMKGLVVNNVGKPVYNARVNYEVIGEDGSVIDKVSIYADQAMLSPGQTSTFDTFMPSGAKVRATSVEWDESK